MSPRKTKDAIELPEFGREYLRILLCVATNDPNASITDDSATRVLDFLKKHNLSPVNTGRFYHHIKGEIQGNPNSLLWDVLQQTIIDYLGRPGLDSLEGIKYFLSLGLPEYQKILNSSTFLDAVGQKTRSGLLRDQPGMIGEFESEQFIVERKAVFDAIRVRIENRDKMIVLFGPQGSGKYTLLRQVANHPGMRRFFRQVVISRCKDRSDYYKLVQQLALECIEPQIVISEQNIDQIEHQLVEKLRFRTSMVLLGDIRDASLFQRIARLFNAHSVFIVSTDIQEVVTDLDPDYNFSIDVPGFSQQETERLFTMMANKDPNDADCIFIHKLGHLYDYRPWILRHFFERKTFNSWNSLNETDLEAIIPYQVIDERLSAISESNRQFINTLVMMPYFYAYDSVSLAAFGSQPRNEITPADVEVIIRDINTCFPLFSPTYSIDGEKLWHFNGYFYNARRKLDAFRGYDKLDVELLGLLRENKQALDKYLSRARILERQGRCKFPIQMVVGQPPLIVRAAKLIFNLSYSPKLKLLIRNTEMVTTYDYRLAHKITQIIQQKLWAVRTVLTVWIFALISANWISGLFSAVTIGLIVATLLVLGSLTTWFVFRQIFKLEKYLTWVTLSSGYSIDPPDDLSARDIKAI